MVTEETSAQTVAEPVQGIGLKVGQSFKNKAVLQTCMRFHAISHHYQYKTVKSCQKQLLLRCINDTCKWYLKSSSSGNSKLFIIRNLNMKHTCPVDTRFNSQRQASSSHIADSIKQNYVNSLKLQVKHSTTEVTTVLNGGIKYTVNMKDRTCTCKRFEIDEIPCQHVVAIINEMNRDPYQFCSIYYMKKNYASNV
ncbi:uncharacterized protein LOC126659464 [Mercurialis annua]|uniref:uncharacterized protein LOC126659464 n=1 Tax=Mercurialis annua TaxID=3986 RepID=UPI00215F947C|nr:uncharacterized protein LOC126659464 [Mercurialis annua]